MTRSENIISGAPQASDGATEGQSTDQPKTNKDTSKPRRGRRQTKTAPRSDATSAEPPAPERPPTKKQMLIDALSADGGTDLAALTAATGWQTHTVRAALTRLKAEGHVVVREPGADGAPARYRIAGAAPVEAAAPNGTAG